MYVRMCDARAFTCGRCGLVWSGVVWSGLYFIPPPLALGGGIKYRPGPDQETRAWEGGRHVVPTKKSG